MGYIKLDQYLCGHGFELHRDVMLFLWPMFVTKQTFQSINVAVSWSSDNDDKVGSDEDDDDFGGGVDDELFTGDAEVPETIEPMGKEKKIIWVLRCIQIKRIN